MSEFVATCLSDIVEGSLEDILLSMEEAEGLGVLFQAVAEVDLLFRAEGSIRQVEAGVEDAPLVCHGGVSVLGPCVVVSLLRDAHVRHWNRIGVNRVLGPRPEIILWLSHL